jgi:hypothetical protein
LKRLAVIIFNLALLTLPTLLWAAGEEPVPSMADRKVRLTDLAGQQLSAVNYFFAQQYNNNKWIFAILVTLLMCGVGMLIALVTDIILKAVGMDVSKIEHHE